MFDFKWGMGANCSQHSLGMLRKAWGNASSVAGPIASLLHVWQFGTISVVEIHVSPHIFVLNAECLKYKEDIYMYNIFSDLEYACTTTSPKPTKQQCRLGMDVKIWNAQPATSLQHDRVLRCKQFWLEFVPTEVAPCVVPKCKCLTSEFWSKKPHHRHSTKNIVPRSCFTFRVKFRCETSV